VAWGGETLLVKELIDGAPKAHADIYWATFARRAIYDTSPNFLISVWLFHEELLWLPRCLFSTGQVVSYDL